MSIDATFSPVSFPALKNDRQDAVDARAHTSGYAAGYAAGMLAAADDIAERVAALQADHDAAMREAAENVERAVALLSAASDALNARILPIVVDAQDAIVRTSIEIAEAVVGRELADGEASARSAVARALSTAEVTTIHQVRLNPLDLAMLRELDVPDSGVLLVADQALSRGDAISEFPDGYLDARLATALGRVRSVLLGQSA